MNTVNSVHSQILREIGKMEPGNAVFPGDFKGIGSEASIKMAFVRLAKEGKLDRVSHGIYTVPKIDPRFGRIPPSLEDIAQAIADRDHARIRPAGAFALNKLGLSTQVPMKLVYLTDGAPRTIQIGKRTIKFKPAAPRSLLYKGPISGLAVQALKELGQKAVSGEVIDKLTKLLTNEDPELMRHDAKLAPNWISRILYVILSNDTRNDTMAQSHG